MKDSIENDTDDVGVIRSIIKSNLNRLLLESEKKFSVGSKSAILCSSADGEGNYCKDEAQKQIEIGSVYLERIKDAYLLKKAKRQDLGDVIDDKEVSNILVVGHSSFSSWIASDGLMHWLDLNEMGCNHLKKGFLAKMGCNNVENEISIVVQGSTAYIPFGINFMLDLNRVYVPRLLLPYEDDLKNPSKFRSVYDRKKTLEQELRKLN